MGSVWVANETLLHGFSSTHRTTEPLNPGFHGAWRASQHQPDGQTGIPKPCVAGSIPARGAQKSLRHERCTQVLHPPMEPKGTYCVHCSSHRDASLHKPVDQELRLQRALQAQQQHHRIRWRDASERGDIAVLRGADRTHRSTRIVGGSSFATMSGRRWAMATATG